MFENISNSEQPTLSPEQKYRENLTLLAGDIDSTHRAIRICEANRMSNPNEMDIKLANHYATLERLEKNRSQLNTISGYVSNFDARNMELVIKSAKPGAKPEIAVDKYGVRYLLAHGYSHADGESKEKRHFIGDGKENVYTNDFICQLITEGKIPANSELIVASCHVSCLDTSIDYPNNVKVRAATSEAGEVYDFNATPDVQPKNNIVTFASQGTYTAAR